MFYGRNVQQFWWPKSWLEEELTGKPQVSVPLNQPVGMLEYHVLQVVGRRHLAVAGRWILMVRGCTCFRTMVCSRQVAQRSMGYSGLYIGYHPVAVHCSESDWDVYSNIGIDQNIDTQNHFCPCMIVHESMFMCKMCDVCLKVLDIMLCTKCTYVHM